jgi:Na+-driven multidrug efflux pump
MRIGVPSSISDLAWTLGWFSMFLIFSTTKNPTACQASWSIGVRIEELATYLPIYALHSTVATIVGQNLGAGNPDRAFAAGWKIWLIGFMYSIVVAMIMIFRAEQIASALSTDVFVRLYAAEYLQCIGISQPFVATYIILFGAMRGAGYTKWPMWTSIFTLLILRLSLAWLLTRFFSDGPLGCWISITVTATILGLCSVWRFKSRIWQLQTV